MARSLGRRGIPVGFVTDEHQIAGFSRYTKFSATWAGPGSDDAANELLELARRYELDGWVLLPSGDFEVRLISQNHALLSSVFRVTTPPWETTQWALDKRLTYEHAAAIGINHPWSYYPRDRQDVAQLECTFPVILKPTTKRHANAFTRAKAWRVDNRAALLSRYDQAVALVGTSGIVLQELIPGDGSTQFSYAAVCDRGQLIASLAARRTRQYPMDFGYTSTFVETVENKEVEEAGSRFLNSLDYSGMAEVEFKYDSRSGQYKILDANMRSWTWISLGGIAGVDFPYILWQIAVGEKVPPMRGRPGAAWMHFERDLVTACHQILAGTLSPVEYLRSFRMPLTFAAFTMDDPLPGIIDVPLLMSRLLTRQLPLIARKISSRLKHSYSS